MPMHGELCHHNIHDETHPNIEALIRMGFGAPPKQYR